MDWRMENNILNGIGDIVSTSQKQYAQEIELLNRQHQEVVHELLKQSIAEQQYYAEAMKEAREQVKYARRGFVVAFIALVITSLFNVYLTWISNKSTNNKDTTTVTIQEPLSMQHTYENQNNHVI